MKNNTLTSDVLELFDSNHITANSLRKFVMESVADFLGDNKHDKAVRQTVRPLVSTRSPLHLDRCRSIRPATARVRITPKPPTRRNNSTRTCTRTTTSGITAGVATRKGKPMKTNWWSAVLSAGITADTRPPSYSSRPAPAICSPRSAAS